LSASAPSSHDLSLAAFTINIAESNFRHTQGRIVAAAYRDQDGISHLRAMVATPKSSLGIGAQRFGGNSPG
jgi:hypothetical protein